MPDFISRVRRRIYEGVNYRLRSFAGGRLAHLCRPTSVALLLTERCNARCVHCDIWKNQGKEDSPTTDEWSRFLREVRGWLGPISIVFTGGEALLKPNTVELAAYASSLGFCLEVLSHGYWDDQHKIQQLALANPSCITISLDGVGATHSRIRGREDFFEKTGKTIETLVQTRRARGLKYRIRLKTVIMDHNLEELGDIARFASRDGMEVFYQPIEQNYNTPVNARWYETSGNWPRDPGRAVGKVQELAGLKRQGLHIANTDAQLQAMVRYFEDPAGLRMATQAHVAHERKVQCSALGMLQVQSSGDVTICSSRPPVGNIRRGGIRRIWEERPRFWEAGCCMQEQLGAAPGQPAGRSGKDGLTGDVLARKP